MAVAAILCAGTPRTFPSRLNVLTYVFAGQGESADKSNMQHHCAFHGSRAGLPVASDPAAWQRLTYILLYDIN